MAGFRVAIPGRGLGVNEQNFLISSAWVIGLVGMIQPFFWGVSNFLHPDPSIDFDFMDDLKGSAEMVMRYVTLPHYGIGFLFMAASARNRTVGRRASIAGLLVLGGLLCLGYAFLGTAFSNEMTGSKTMRFHWSETGASPLALYAILFYFLAHELRDQAMFYVATDSSGVIADRPLFDRFVNWLIGLSIGTFATVIWSALVLGQQSPALVLPELTGNLRAVIALAPVAFCVLGLGALARWYAHATGQTVKEMGDRHGPLIRVFVGVFLWISLGFALRLGIYLLILFHVVGWYVFTCYKLKERGQASPAADWLTWTRTNLSGFRTLHVGLVVAFIAVGAVWTYGFEGHGPLWYVLAPGAFLYWTITHITVSFLPR
ncbi:MAG: hypothetical protein E7813_05250 [Bradyrhizobium sp.]|uniref:hypothetical protein n=1 Tax=Bradyrhizobium sp. TaxID=376 RepID=UPI00121F0A7D|nr:hypothetical protein [Bradyrhizobium sp.]THD71687.1 MAG: hypothetical protein E7813_05250 [Bradyrhizobium sp.]